MAVSLDRANRYAPPGWLVRSGVVQVTSVMRTWQIGDRPTKLAQAVAEGGRVDKTIHRLTFIDDETKRRRTLTTEAEGMSTCL